MNIEAVHVFKYIYFTFYKYYYTNNSKNPFSFRTIQLTQLKIYHRNRSIYYLNSKANCVAEALVIALS